MLSAPEFETLTGFLDTHRDIFARRVSNLDDLTPRIPGHPTTMSLGGLLKHLAFVETYWFTYVLGGEDPGEPWASADWETDPDWDWHSAADDSPEDLHRLWQASVDQSRTRVDQVARQHSLDHTVSAPDRSGHVSLRWILVHMIAEYARHNGHADLVREQIDGQVGD